MPSSTSQVVHLLSRTGIRIDPERVAHLVTLELAEAVNEVCDFTKNPPFALPDQSAYKGASGGLDAWRWGEAARTQWFDRLATLPNPLEAKLTLFWHSHFAVSQQKVDNMAQMAEYYRKLATLGSGPFEVLCQAVAIDEALLVYLDNRANVVGVPQENFARELMELFVLGANKGYTQSDVREAARAWTGFGLRYESSNNTLAYEFRPSAHDAGMKTIFGITKNWTGPQVITEMCSGVRVRETAQHLAAKLWEFFAYEQPEPALVAALGDEYASTGLNTLNFLKRMFLRPEFYSDRAIQGRVKTPVEWCAMVLAATGMNATDAEAANHAGWAGHDLFYPPSVAGWKLNNVWLNEAEFWALDAAAKTITYRLMSYEKINPPLRSKFAAVPTLSVPAAVDLVTSAFGLINLSASTRQALERWLAEYRALGVNWGEAASLIRLVSLSTEARLA
jgi:uncharacterized protein (DUF1800 family)